MPNVPPKIFTEQYGTKITEKEHQDLQEAVKWLIENKYPIKSSKYDITRYSLLNLTSFVKFKRAKANGDPPKTKEEPKIVEPVKVEEPKKEVEGNAV